MHFVYSQVMQCFMLPWAGNEWGTKLPISIIFSYLLTLCSPFAPSYNVCLLIFLSNVSHIISLPHKSYFFHEKPWKNFLLKATPSISPRSFISRSFIFRNFLESHASFLFPIMLLIQYRRTKHSMHQTHLLWQAKPSDKRSVKRHNLRDYRLLRLYYVLLISPTAAEMINDALSCWINEAPMSYSAAFGNFRKFGFVIIGGILGVWSTAWRIRSFFPYLFSFFLIKEQVFVVY